MVKPATKKQKAPFKSRLGATVPAEDLKAKDALVQSRVTLLIKNSFFGNLATRLKLVNADEWCETAATDGRSFYYNSRFINSLRQKEVQFLFGHEVLHCVYDHFGRRGSRDAQLFNIAADYCVNADLKKHRIGEFITTVDCLYDAKYEGWSAEQVYDDLFQNMEKISLEDLIEQMLDEHMDGDGDADGDGDGNGDGKSKRPSLTAEERQAIRDELREAIITAAQSCDNAGNLPAGVKKLIKDITAPTLDWRELIQQQLESAVKSDYTWMRSSRRGWHLDAILPGSDRDKMVDIVVFMDQSGSINNKMTRDQLGEIQGIMEQFPNFRIILGTFDTEVYNVQEFNSDNIVDITDYEVHGGGGTDFGCMFNYMKNNDIEPKRLVVFTDGYPCGTWGDENYADTLWIIHGNNTVVPPYGTWAYYSN
jgi:predicted metal-dependent peptidase